LDALDSVPLERDVAGVIGVENEGAGIGLDDGSTQAVAILQRDLIGEGVAAKEEENRHG